MSVGFDSAALADSSERRSSRAECKGKNDEQSIHHSFHLIETHQGTHTRIVLSYPTDTSAPLAASLLTSRTMPVWPCVVMH